jgi:hypothetical protein
MDDGTNLKAPPTRRQVIVGVAIAFSGLSLRSTETWAGAEEEVSRTEEAIHQEAVFKASRKRVYESLTDTKQFDKVIQLSGVMQSMPSRGSLRKSAVKWEARSHSLAGISRGVTSNSCRTSESFKPGEQAAGIQASTRLRSSSLPSTAPEPGLSLTILVFPRATRNIWRRDGRSIIGSHSKNFSPQRERS